MTELYSITKEQRDQFIAALSIPEHHLEGEDRAAIEALQSLPVLDGEPVCYVELGSHGRVFSMNDNQDSECVTPLYTHPMPPITEDMVTDEMVDALNQATHPASSRKEIMAAAVNAYLGVKK